ASWVYRLVKRFLFYDFGVYDGHDESHSQLSAPALVELQTDGNASADQNDELLPVISQ
ncbi:MAG: hypothetical protein HON53_16015, partial [Planctomycetaceae bacterium]|nr:hypothetical protein [Planctomycetaceae bacterium]